MGRVVHFEIPADDPWRAARFYRDVFGWDINDWGGGEEYLLATTGPEEEIGINGAITRRTAPVTRLVATIEVDSLDAAVLRMAEAGGRIIEERKPIPGIGWHAYCEDPEGNVIGVLQPDDQAP